MNIDNSIPIINMETFDDLSSILEDDFYGLLEDFINETPSQLALLNAAVEQSDFKSIFAVSHSQSGASGNLGLDKFHKLCEHIGTEAKNRNIENCQQLSRLIDDCFAESKLLLTEKIKNH